MEKETIEMIEQVTETSLGGVPGSIHGALTVSASAPLEGQQEPPVLTMTCTSPDLPAFGAQAFGGAKQVLPAGMERAGDLLADTSLVIPPEVVEGLMHKGTMCVLGGCSKTYKSWVALQLATSVASGTTFLGRKTVAGKVLYLNYELMRAFLSNRLNDIAAASNGTNLDNLTIKNMEGVSPQWEELKKDVFECARNGDYSLIIFDPVYKMMAGGSENSPKAVAGLCRMFREIASETGAAVLFVHHFPKGNPSRKRPLDRLAGSGMFARDPDTILTLSPHAEQGCFIFEAGLRNFPPLEPFVIQRKDPLMVERPDLSVVPVQEDAGDGWKSVLPKLLEEKPLTVKEWQSAALDAGCPRSTFFRVKKILVSGSLVQEDLRAKTWSRKVEEPAITPVGIDQALC